MSGNFSRLKPATKRHNANISMAYGCEKDPNTYCYRLTNGHKHLHRIILGRGWEHTPFDVTKLSCYEGKKGEESMTHRTGYHKQWLPWDELMPKVKELQAQGYETSVIAQRLGIKKDTLWKRIALEKKRAQTPKPEGDQPDPAQDATEPAKAIILNTSPIDPADFYTEQAYIKAQPGDLNYTPDDNDYNEEPQRTTLPRAQSIAIAMNDDRMSALAIFCENQAVEQLRQDWAVDIFKHSRLSRERKLELIGQLLDWRAEE